MKTETSLPAPIENYLHAINTHDAVSFTASFAPDAVVHDIGREIRGLAAIEEWGRNEIFTVNVTLEVLSATERADQTIVTVKVDGTFDRTGLPDPLVMDHSFTIVGDQITALTCRLAGNQDA